MSSFVRLKSVLPVLLALPGVAQIQTPPPQLVVNEVSVCSPDYVELLNKGTRPVILSGLRIVTSQGTFTLGSPTGYRLQPGDYFVLVRGLPGMDAVSDVPEVRMQIVGQPILGALGDTVLLTDATGRILDAMSYGVVADTSVRYEQAVASGQFASGQFVDVGGRFGALAMGRNASGADSNDLAADWRLHGGADAWAGSPFDANAAVVGGEESSIQAVQERLNQIFLSIYSTSVTSASAANYAGTDASSSADHTLVLDSAELGAFTVAGAVTWTFTPGPGGDHSIHYGGVLTEASGDRGLMFDVTETIVGTARSLQLTADLFESATGVHRPYTEQVTLDEAGVRGNHTVTQTRSLTDWFGITRTTQGTCVQQWNLVNGALVDIAATIDIVRDWPIVPNPISQGANPPNTTETLHMEGTATETGNRLEFQFPVYTSDYGAMGSATVAGASLIATCDIDNDSVAVERNETGTFTVSGSSFTRHLRVSGTTTAVPGTEHAAIAGDYFFDDVLAGSFQGFIDPPSGAAPDESVAIDWDKWKRRLKKAAKKVAQAAAIAVVGAWCALTTFLCGVAAVAGTVTVWGFIAGCAGVMICGAICAVLLWLLS